MNLDTGKPFRPHCDGQEGSHEKNFSSSIRYRSRTECNPTVGWCNGQSPFRGAGGAYECNGCGWYTDATATTAAAEATQQLGVETRLGRALAAS